MLAFLLSCQVKRAVKVTLNLPVSSESASKINMVNNCTSLSGLNDAAVPAGIKNVFPFLIVLLAAIPLMLIPGFQNKPDYFFVSTSFSNRIPLFLYHRNIRVWSFCILHQFFIVISIRLNSFLWGCLQKGRYKRYATKTQTCLPSSRGTKSWSSGFIILGCLESIWQNSTF